MSPVFRLTFIDAILGPGRLAVVDAGTARRDYVRWRCGCEADRMRDDVFTVAPCRGHAGYFDTSEKREDARH